MKKYRFSRFVFSPVAALVALLGLAQAAFATNYTYSGATGDWSVSTNWTPNGNPNAIGDSITRTAAGNVTLTQDVLGGRTVGSISTSAVSGNFTINASNNIILNFNGTSAGTALISNASTATGVRLLFASTGTLVLADDLTISNTSANTSTTGAIQIDSVITGTGNIFINNISSNPVSVAASAGQIRLTAANTFTGTVTLERGTVSSNNLGVFGNISTNTVVLGSVGGGDTTFINTASQLTMANNFVVAAGSGGILTLGSTSTGSGGIGGTVQLNGDLNVLAQNIGVNAFVFSNVISGTGSLTTSGTGQTRLMADNTYTGGTRIASGVLQLGSNVGNTSLGLQNSTLDMNLSDSGTLAFGTGATTTINAATLGGLKGSRNIALVNNNTAPAAVTLTIGNNNSSNTYSGTLSGAGSIIKVGTGTQTFTGVQAYTGSTAVTVGTLIVNGSLGSGGVTVSSGARLGGDITVAGTTSVAGTLAVGNSPGTGNFSTLNLQAGSTTETQFLAGATARGTDYDAINVSTALTYSGTLKLVFLGSANNQTFDLFNFGALVPSGSFSSVALFANTTSIGTLTNTLGVWAGNYDLGFGGGTQSFTFTQSTGDLIIAVPEPSVVLLVGMGFGCMIYMVRRRRGVA